VKSFDKFAFFQDLGYTPHPGQLPVHQSKAPRRVLACGVRWGKTRVAAWEALAAAIQPRKESRGWIVAPTYDLGQKVFREVVELSTTRLRHRIRELKESERLLMLSNLAGGRSEIRVKSADNPTSLLGEALDWVVIDEAAQLKSSIWQSYISQRLVDRHGWSLTISTPRGRGWFYEAYQRGQGRDADYQSWNCPSWQNPSLDADLIEAERARLPESVFAQEYAGAFIEGTGAVFRHVREAATGVLQEAKQGERYFAGIDLARTEDYTVLVVMNNKHQVVFVDRFHRLDWGLQVARLKAGTSRYPFCSVLVDSTGVGEPIYELLKKAGMHVQAYTLTAKSKSDIITNLMVMLEQRQIQLPTYQQCPELVEELEGFEYSLTDDGNVRMRAAGSGHDDSVIALALAAWESTKFRGVGTVTVLNTHRYGSYGQWRSLASRLTLRERLRIGGFRV
jgi:hypothetical protein